MASLTHQDFGPKLAQSNNVHLPHSPWSREDEVLWLAYDPVTPAACQSQDPPGSTSPVAPSPHALRLLSHISLPFEGAKRVGISSRTTSCSGPCWSLPPSLDCTWTSELHVGPPPGMILSLGRRLRGFGGILIALLRECIWRAEARDAAPRPTVQRTARPQSPANTNLGQNLNSAETAKP